MDKWLLHITGTILTLFDRARRHATTHTHYVSSAIFLVGNLEFMCGGNVLTINTSLYNLHLDYPQGKPLKKI